MVTKRFCSVVLLLQVLFAMTWSQEPIDLCRCRYIFVEQPSNAIMCNPYPTGRFTTRCIIDYSSTEGTPLSIAWFSRRLSNSLPQLLTGGFSTMGEINRVRSELTIELTAGNEATYEGFRYFCRVSFFNGTLLRNSQEFYLFPQSVVMPGGFLDYETCSDTSVQSTLLEECIDNRTLPTTPPPTTLPPTTTPPTTPPPTTTSSPTTPPPTTTTLPPTTTSPPTTPPPTTTTLPPTTSPPTTPLSHTTPPPTTPPPTTPPPPVNTRRNPLTFEEEVLLYSAIAAAVVLVMVIVVLILCLCCWNRVCQRSGYCTCYSKY